MECTLSWDKGPMVSLFTFNDTPENVPTAVVLGEVVLEHCSALHSSDQAQHLCAEVLPAAYPITVSVIYIQQ